MDKQSQSICTLDIHLIDVEALALAGLTKGWQRDLAMLASIGIAVFVAYFSYEIGKFFIGDGVPVTTLVWGAMITPLYYLFTGRFLPAAIIGLLIKNTPVAVLHRSDLAILEAIKPYARQVLHRVTKKEITQLAAYSPYPATKETSRVISHLGNIDELLKRPDGIACAARFAYKYLMSAQVAVKGEIGFEQYPFK